MVSKSTPESHAQEDAVVAVPDDDAQSYGLDNFAALIAEGGFDATDSMDIINREAKDTLIGVPFMITSMTFRPSEKVRGDDYVSLEVTTSEGDPLTGRNRRLVVNDSGTGIRRQAVKYLVAKRIVDPGKGDETGSATRYDNPCWQWDVLSDQADIIFDEDATATVTVTGLRFLARKGLRVSDYENDSGEGQTYYLN